MRDYFNPINLDALPQGLPFWHPAAWISTLFGIGLVHPGAGTWGSFLALIFAWPVFDYGGLYALYAGIVLLFILGLWSSRIYIQKSGVDDNRAIVIDEAVGQWIALIPICFIPKLWPVAFILFRFFDILKPWPISWVQDKVKGAFGTMIDDVLAGAVSAVILATYIYFFPWD